MKRFLSLLLCCVLSVSGCIDPKVRQADEGLQKTVSITVEGVDNGKPYSLIGSGVFISPEGHVLSCAHLFTKGEIKSITVEDVNGVLVAGELIYKEPRRDLAILKTAFVTAGRWAIIAYPATVKVGQEVIACGSPLGYSFSVTHGIISATNRDFPWAYNTTQTDIMPMPGNSGGPIFNADGEVVGIASFFILANQFVPYNSGLSLMVSAAQIREFLTRFKHISAGIGRKE